MKNLLIRGYDALLTKTLSRKARRIFNKISSNHRSKQEQPSSFLKKFHFLFFKANGAAKWSTLILRVLRQVFSFKHSKKAAHLSIKSCRIGKSERRSRKFTMVRSIYTKSQNILIYKLNQSSLNSNDFDANRSRIKTVQECSKVISQQ